jgi:DNA-binding PadR family transcriptional regulator
MRQRRLLLRPGTSLPAPAFYVLLSLSSGDRHAAAILEDVVLSSAGRVQVGRRAIAGNLKRLIEAELVERVDQDLFRLTHEGRKTLAAELERMEQALKVARRPRT